MKFVFNINTDIGVGGDNCVVCVYSLSHTTVMLTMTHVTWARLLLVQLLLMMVHQIACLCILRVIVARSGREGEMKFVTYTFNIV